MDSLTNKNIISQILGGHQKVKLNNMIQLLENINGRNVWIYVTNKLYGDQKIKCALRLINDKERLGFSIKGQEIYINKKEICDFKVQEKKYYFANEIMSIEIRQLNWQ